MNSSDSDGVVDLLPAVVAMLDITTVTAVVTVVTRQSRWSSSRGLLRHVAAGCVLC
jgi:hypothetical protein